ncbi:MAG: hypothetical protein A2939_02600 [Parcubacteria group bacterium RIFCSPLOWO2_01_FULL_48_18]|nr:MAG: hypothetical protein A2939_02600 [Parcubacteria group bacterium RIFCSPLOWO2_01_FULL_48_18]OHB23670.1 MAG: hypothetical protein A3J67_06315 [Parcubacteria group bacterium RIFCSPHIGHO2_02_FULL_48_10b]
MNQLFRSLIRVQNEKEAAEFLNDFFTLTEKRMLAKRLAIAVLLHAGANYKEINALLKVSHTTINRVSNAIALGGKAYQKTADDIMNVLLRHRGSATTNRREESKDMVTLIKDFFDEWDNAKLHSVYRPLTKGSR